MNRFILTLSLFPSRSLFPFLSRRFTIHLPSKLEMTLLTASVAFNFAATSD